MGGIIRAIEPNSIAEELGWEPGDEIVSINGHKLRDAIDYRFYSADEFLTVLVRRDCQEAEFEIEKDFDIPLGVEFTDELFDGVRLCGAHCIFCFVEQLPKGMRKSLYLKDDDYRLSFLHGNFVTLANLTDEDLERIVIQRLTPLYVSVHTTDADLRERMLGRKAPDILSQIDFLSQGNITLHTQIVLCRGVNDDLYLDKSVEDLASRYPTVQSIAVVPAGFSKHRRNPAPIGSIDPEYSSDILRKVRRWQRRFMSAYGTRLIWAADEFYLNAEQPVPRAEAYEGFPQIENGVGLVRKFKDSAYRANRMLPYKLPRRINISIVTGQSAAPLLNEWALTVKDRGLDIKVYPVVNNLFGESVTVAGLMVGRDVVDQLKGKHLGEALFIPSVALRDNTFLDDVKIRDIEDALNVRIIDVEPLPVALVRAILRLV